MMSEAASSKAGEEYEDDFEKDLDWLISEESKREEQTSREAGEDKEWTRADEGWNRFSLSDNEEDERWPTPLDPLDSVLDDSKDQQDEEEMDEENKSILQKIKQANRQLQYQEAPNGTRHRRLHFKDNLVDLVVPANDYHLIIHNEPEADNLADVSGHMQKLKIATQEASDATDGASEGRVLVEKDGKFDLVSLKEMGNQGLLPPLSFSHIEGHQQETGKSSSPSQKLHSSSASSACTELCYVPKPPARPRMRPNSASLTQRAGRMYGSKRRVQSASGVIVHATFSMSPQQKELLTKQQLKKERLAKEEEERKWREEEKKRQENELAFRTWLLKKRQQLQVDRRVQRAQEMERMSEKRELYDPEGAFKLWLQKKEVQQLKERQLEEMRRLELQSNMFLHRPEDCEKAFRLWLRRKQVEKRLKQRAFQEHSRRLLMEERRIRRMQDIYYPVNEIRSCRYSEPYKHRF